MANFSICACQHLRLSDLGTLLDLCLSAHMRKQLGTLLGFVHLGRTVCLVVIYIPIHTRRVIFAFGHACVEVCIYIYTWSQLDACVLYMGLKSRGNSEGLNTKPAMGLCGCLFMQCRSIVCTHTYACVVSVHAYMQTKVLA